MISTTLKIPQDEYVKVGSVKTRYWRAGDKGTPVILLHGGGGSVEFWLYNIPVLAKHHRVYAFDMVGSGLSDKPSATYCLTYQAQFIKNFMQALGIDRATLIGNSMGGGASLQFALLFPERLHKLVLVNSFGLGKEISFGLRLTSIPFVVRSLRPNRSIFEPMIRHDFHDPTCIPQEWIEIRYPIFALPGRQKALEQLARSNLSLLGVRRSVYRPLVEQLSNIAAPTLIVWGKQDRILPVAHAHVAAKHLPNSQLHIFDPCGHHPHLERPDEFNNLVLEFLAR